VSNARANGIDVSLLADEADTQPVVLRGDIVAPQCWCGVVDRNEDVQGAIIVEIAYRHSACS
jgi:hypothetical protein